MDLKLLLGRYRSSASYTQRADKTITWIGLTFPFVMTGYGALIQYGLIRSSNNLVSLPAFYIIMTIFIMFGFLQTWHPGATPLSSALRLLEFYTMSGIYVLMVTGVNNPFTFCWPILMLASYTYFEMTGLKLGILAFTILICTDIFFLHFGDMRIIVSDIMLYITVLITGIAVITVMRTHEIQKAKLFQNLIKESLQRDRMATIVNNLTDAILSTDTKGVIKVYNAASLALLDTNENLNNRNIDKVLPLVDQSGKPISVLSELKSSKAVVRRDDLNYVFTNGEKIRLETTYTPIRSGYSRTQKGEIHDGYIIIMRDITKPKNLEEERNEFISVISHELRTPITITEGTISNVQEMMDHPNITNAMISDAIAVAHEQVLLLANIVNDLSALSHAERGMDNNPEDIDVHELISALVEKHSDAAKDKNLKIITKVDHNIDIIYVSRTYIEELLKNLILNAIKYTKKGHITVSVSQQSDQITFAITDTGIGISKTDQPHIFDKFYRSEDFRTRETGGTGLGLYVAATLASNMGSKIDLKSEINKGSTFSFSLPKPPRKKHS